MAPLRILLVDDHAIRREGIRMLLSKVASFLVVRDAGDDKQAIARAATLVPDVVVMDITMPVLDGLQATKHINNHSPELEQ